MYYCQFRLDLVCALNFCDHACQFAAGRLPAPRVARARITGREIKAENKIIIQRSIILHRCQHTFGPLGDLYLHYQNSH